MIDMKMYEDDNMDKFIVEQRARLAHERQTLDKNPTSAISEYILDEEKTRKEPVQQIQNQSKQFQSLNPSSKENIIKTKPPTPQILKLGEAYKQHKEKLKEELRLEYRQALAEKQIRSTGVRGKKMASHEDGLPNDLGLSLPIRDHISAKERLRLERNREYNQFKANKENEEKLTSPRRLVATDKVVDPSTVANDATQTVPPINQKASRASESYEELLEKKREQERAYRRSGIHAEERDRRERKKYNDENNEELIPRRVGFSKKKRAQHIEYYDDRSDDDDDETEEELIQRLRARRQRRRRRARQEVESDEFDDDMLFRRVRTKGEPVQKERRRLSSGEERTRIALEKENDLRSKSAPPEQEFTGLPIGRMPSATTVQKRKEEYKMELTRQMEGDRERKLREKQLDKQSVVGLKDNNQSDRTLRHQASKKGKEDSSPDSGEEQHIVKRKGKKKSQRRIESSDSGSDYEKKMWKSRSRFPQYYPPPPPAMNGFYPPPPMSHPSLVDDAYYYYGSQNPLNPSIASGGFANPSQRNLQPGISPLLAAADSKLRAHQVSNDPPSSTFLPQNQPSKGSVIEPSLGSDETKDAKKKREMMQSYQEELKLQMMIKEKKKQEEKREEELYDRKKEAEADEYNPWGKGGGGAPMKDQHGNLISDLRQMHIQNEDLVRDPTKVVELAKQRQQIIRNTEEIFQTPRKQETEMFDTSPRYGRSNPFEEKASHEQRTQKDTYKDELRKQIEEKRRLDAERKEQLRILEEKEEKRMQEDARKMKEELENEQRKQREKIEEQRRKNEEMQNALAEKREEEERKRKEEQRKREEEERRDKERELDEKLKKQHSTPRANDERKSIRTPQETAPKQVYSNTTRPAPTTQAQDPQTVLRSYNPTPNPTARPEQSRESKRISRELSALRKQLLNEQQRIEDQLRGSDGLDRSNYQPSMLNTNTLVDLSRVRQRPVHVRRPPTVDRPNSKALKDFSAFKHRQDDTTSLRMFRIQHPDTPMDTDSLEKQQEDLMKAQMMKIETLKSQMEFPHQGRARQRNYHNESTMLPPSQSFTSLLDADTTFIPVPDDVENLPPTAPSSRTRKQSARERRRNKRNDEEGGLTYRATPDNYSMQSLNSLATLDIDRMANKNQTRLDNLKALQGDDVSLTDPDDILDRFINQQKTSSVPQTPDLSSFQTKKPRQGTSVSAPQHERPPSVNTVDTELWLRPGTTT